MKLEELIRTEAGHFIPTKFEAVWIYFLSSKREIEKRTNGTGPNNWFVNLFPETWRSSILGLDCEEPSNIHDEGYAYKNPLFTKEDYIEWKKLQDRIHRDNNYRAIDYYKSIGDCGAIRVYLAKKIADIYYWFLKKYGDKAFWKNK